MTFIINYWIQFPERIISLLLEDKYKIKKQTFIFTIMGLIPGNTEISPMPLLNI